MTDRGSSLPAALAGFDLLCDAFDAWVLDPADDGKELLAAVAEVEPTHLHNLAEAARERLRLSKLPCENCQGDPHKIDRWTCPSCGGSGEVWPAELVEVVAVAFAMAAGWTFHSIEPVDPGSNARKAARAVLDAVEKWMEAK